jgi:sulfofructosephosphate aldolase
MLAIDQRETLRALLADVVDGPVDHDAVVDFKLEVTRSLSPHASAVLVDTVYGLDPIDRAGARAPSCGLIVAADRFEQAPGGPVEWVHLDEDAGRRAADAGADALKLLVPWRRGAEEAARARLVEGFMDLCSRLRLLAIVEGVVRGPRGSSDPVAPEVLGDALLEAASELCSFAPDLYKAEVPTLGRGSDDEIERRSREVTRIVGRPWVVLSAGVPLERFESAALAAFRGGASGFLAGRGIWRPALAPGTRERELQEVSTPRLQRLVAAVDEHARPWWEARPTGHGA